MRLVKENLQSAALENENLLSGAAMSKGEPAECCTGK